MKIFSYLARITIGLYGLIIITGCATSQSTGASTITTSTIEILPAMAKCNKALDDRKRTYEVKISGLEPTEQLRIFTKGWVSSNETYTASELLDKAVKLPAVSIQSRVGGDNQGLWIERVSSGERQQLNRLTPNTNCNTKGITTVEYPNIWISLTR